MGCCLSIASINTHKYEFQHHLTPKKQSLVFLMRNLCCIVVVYTLSGPIDRHFLLSITPHLDVCLCVNLMGWSSPALEH